MLDNRYKYRFSIFTSTYNRGEMLYRLYEELKVQTFKDFEWVIINDGSTDDTDKIVRTIQKENILDIQYVSKKNGGKHTAWQVATPLFRGRYVLTADDDDPITNDMLEVFNRHWSDLEQSPLYNDFWEVRTRCRRPNGTLVGNQLPTPIFDSDYNTVCYKMKVFCEMVGCRKVEILRGVAAVPDVFPFMEDASNFAEGIRWSRAARQYKTRFVNDVTRIYNDTQNSLSADALSRCMNGEKRIIANKMVEFYFYLLEQRDLLFHYNTRRYFKVLFGYSLLRALSNYPQTIENLSLVQKIYILSMTPLCKVLLFYIKRKK